MGLLVGLRLCGPVRVTPSPWDKNPSQQSSLLVFSPAHVLWPVQHRAERTPHACRLRKLKGLAREALFTHAAPYSFAGRACRAQCLDMCRSECGCGSCHPRFQRCGVGALPVSDLRCNAQHHAKCVGNTPCVALRQAPVRQVGVLAWRFSLLPRIFPFAGAGMCSVPAVTDVPSEVRGMAWSL